MKPTSQNTNTETHGVHQIKLVELNEHCVGLSPMRMQCHRPFPDDIPRPVGASDTTFEIWYYSDSVSSNIYTACDSVPLRFLMPTTWPHVRFSTHIVGGSKVTMQTSLVLIPWLRTCVGGGKSLFIWTLLSALCWIICYVISHSNPTCDFVQPFNAYFCALSIHGFHWRKQVVEDISATGHEHFGMLCPSALMIHRTSVADVLNKHGCFDCIESIGWGLHRNITAWEDEMTAACMNSECERQKSWQHLSRVLKTMTAAQKTTKKTCIHKIMHWIMHWIMIKIIVICKGVNLSNRNTQLVNPEQCVAALQVDLLRFTKMERFPPFHALCHC